MMCQAVAPRQRRVRGAEGMGPEEQQTEHRGRGSRSPSPPKMGLAAPPPSSSMPPNIGFSAADICRGSTGGSGSGNVKSQAWHRAALWVEVQHVLFTPVVPAGIRRGCRE